MRKFFAGLSILTLLGLSPILHIEPVRAQLFEIKEKIADSLFSPEIKLLLKAEKQVTKVGENGISKAVWQPIEGRTVVQPGDILRYTVDGSNSGDVAATNLEITQPVPGNTTYILKSAVGASRITYSIDGGKSYTTQPQVEITLPDGSTELQPAPPEMYTHIQWSFDKSLATASAVEVSYSVSVD